AQGGPWRVPSAIDLFRSAESSGLLSGTDDRPRVCPPIVARIDLLGTRGAGFVNICWIAAGQQAWKWQSILPNKRRPNAHSRLNFGEFQGKPVDAQLSGRGLRAEVRCGRGGCGKVVTATTFSPIQLRNCAARYA